MLLPLVLSFLFLLSLVLASSFLFQAANLKLRKRRLSLCLHYPENRALGWPGLMISTDRAPPLLVTREVCGRDQSHRLVTLSLIQGTLSD